MTSVSASKYVTYIPKERKFLLSTRSGTLVASTTWSREYFDCFSHRPTYSSVLPCVSARCGTGYLHSTAIASWSSSKPTLMAQQLVKRKTVKPPAKIWSARNSRFMETFLHHMNLQSPMKMENWGKTHTTCAVIALVMNWDHRTQESEQCR